MCHPDPRPGIPVASASSDRAGSPWPGPWLRALVVRPLKWPGQGAAIQAGYTLRRRQEANLQRLACPACRPPGARGAGRDSAGIRPPDADRHGTERGVRYGLALEAALRPGPGWPNRSSPWKPTNPWSGPMAPPDQDHPEQARQYALTLLGIMRRSSWYARGSVREQETAYKRMRRAELLGYRADEQACLAAAIDRRERLRSSTGRGVKAARRAAQVLQEREERLLEDLATYPTPYLLAELGQPPANRDGRMAWLRGAHAIERHRTAYHVNDPDRAFSDGHHVGRFEHPVGARTRSAPRRSWTTSAAPSPKASPASWTRPRGAGHRGRPGVRGLAVIPTSVVDEDRHRGQAVERGVWSPVIVGPQPPGEGAAALVVGAIQPPIGPLLQQGAVEPLNLPLVCGR
jgi:hypothetical protein